MIKSKWTVIIAPILVLALTLGIFLLQTEKQTESPKYQTELFGKDIVNIDVSVDEQLWQNMLDNAKSEEFISADLTIDGTKVSTVGIRPKGNSSLTQVESSGSDRFSFRISFDEYIAGQNYMGLDRMVLNNSQGDNTFMKDYITYDLMEYMGVDAPLTTYVNLTVNGEQFGVYLAVEFYGDGYEKRVNGDVSGNIYSVKMSGMGGDKDNFGMNLPGRTEGGASQGFGGFGGMPQGNFNPDEMPQMPEFNPDDVSQKAQDEGLKSARRGQSDSGGGMGGRGGGGDLVYTDDSPDSYSSIFENAIGKTTSSAENRMIAAIKALNTGEDLEEYWDVDKVLRYLAVHTFVVNLDSYSGSMKQNYALYEKDGVVSVLPWDYNLAFGSFQGGDAVSAINFPIDTPVSGANMEDRPLINTLLSNDEYKAKYHEYLSRICIEYVQGGILESKINDASATISPYVETDPTKFCTFEEFETALDALSVFCILRAQSIEKQLSGEIPSTTDGQKNADNLILADEKLASAMGRGFGGGGGGMSWGNRDKSSEENRVADPQNAENLTEEKPSEENSGETAEKTPSREMPGGRGQGFQAGERTGGEQSFGGGRGDMPERGGNGEQSQGRESMKFGRENREQTVDLTRYIPLGICVLIFIIAFAFAISWKRKY